MTNTEAVKRYRLAHPNRVHASQRKFDLKRCSDGSRCRWHLQHKFHLSVQEYDRLLEQQNYSCAICKTEKPNGRGTWNIDHDHQTGKIRGLLCWKCNFALGLFGDEVKILKDAVEYLEKE